MDMTIRINNLLAPLLLMAILAGCADKKETPKQAPPKIQVVNILQQDLPLYQSFVGQVYGEEDVSINARVEGFLTGIHFEEGTRVNKGDLLYTIDSEPFLAKLASEKSRVAEARTRLINAENELRRYEPLAEIDAVSQSDLDFAKANKDASQAALEAAQASQRMAEINLSYTRVKAPIDGFIGRTMARVGEFVGRSPNPVILNVVSKVTTMRVQFFITETQYLTLVREVTSRTGNLPGDNDTPPEDKVDIRLILSDGSEHPYPGKVDFVNREIDDETGALLIQATFPNPDRILKPGQFARVKIRMQIVSGALLIPQRTVSELQGRYSVFVVTPDNKIESRQIGIQSKHKDYYLVSSGLQPTDKIVLEGLQKVGTGMVVEPVVTEYVSQVID